MASAARCCYGTCHAVMLGVLMPALRNADHSSNKTSVGRVCINSTTTHWDSSNTCVLATRGRSNQLLRVQHLNNLRLVRFGIQIGTVRDHKVHSSVHQCLSVLRERVCDVRAVWNDARLALHSEV